MKAPFVVAYNRSRVSFCCIKKIQASCLARATRSSSPAPLEAGRVGPSGGSSCPEESFACWGARHGPQPGCLSRLPAPRSKNLFSVPYPTTGNRAPGCQRFVAGISTDHSWVMQSRCQTAPLIANPPLFPQARRIPTVRPASRTMPRRKHTPRTTARRPCRANPWRHTLASPQRGGKILCMRPDAGTVLLGHNVGDRIAEAHAVATGRG